MFLFCCFFQFSNRNSIHDFHTIIRSLCDKTTRIQCSDDVGESSVNIRIIQASAQLIFFSLFSNKQNLNLLAVVQNESTSCRMWFFFACYNSYTRQFVVNNGISESVMIISSCHSMGECCLQRAVFICLWQILHNKRFRTWVYMRTAPNLKSVCCMLSTDEIRYLCLNRARER